MARQRGSGRPTELKLVAREKKSRINTDEPQPQDGVPVCPSPDPDVQEVWDYTVEQLKVMKTISMADRDSLHTYCEAVVMQRRALALIRSEGAIMSGPQGGRATHPAVAIARNAAVLVRSMGGLFGLTPSARSAIKVGDQRQAREAGAGRLLTG